MHNLRGLEILNPTLLTNLALETFHHDHTEFSLAVFR